MASVPSRASAATTARRWTATAWPMSRAAMPEAALRPSAMSSSSSGVGGRRPRTPGPGTRWAAYWVWLATRNPASSRTATSAPSTLASRKSRDRSVTSRLRASMRAVPRAASFSILPARITSPTPGDPRGPGPGPGEASPPHPHAAGLALSDELHQVADLRAGVQLRLDPLEGAGEVQPRPHEDPVGAPEALLHGGRHAGPLKAHLVDGDGPVGAAGHQHVGHDVLVDPRHSTDHGQGADPGELDHAHHPPEDSPVLDDHVPAQLRVVGDDDPPPQLAVVAGVGVGQHLGVVADHGGGLLARRPADGDVLPDHHAVADVEVAPLALEVPVLRDPAQHRPRVDAALAADPGPLLDDHVRPDPRAVADRDVVPDHRAGPHLHPAPELGAAGDARGGVGVRRPETRGLLRVAHRSPLRASRSCRRPAPCWRPPGSPWSR